MTTIKLSFAKRRDLYSFFYSYYQRAMPLLVVLGGLLFLLYKYVLQISPSVMTYSLMSAFHLNGLGMGALTASWFWTMLTAQFFAGPILDKYSSKWVSPLAILISALGALAFSQSSSLNQAFWSRSLMGVGAAFATVSYLKLTADWFSGRTYSIVCGLLLTGVTLGSLLAQTPLALLVKYSGWQRALLDCALLGVLVACLYFFLIPSPKREDALFSSKQGVSLNACLSIVKSSNNWWLMLYSGLAFTPLAVFGGLWGMCLWSAFMT